MYYNMKRLRILKFRLIENIKLGFKIFMCNVKL